MALIFSGKYSIKKQKALNKYLRDIVCKAFQTLNAKEYY